MICTDHLNSCRHYILIYVDITVYFYFLFYFVLLQTVTRANKIKICDFWYYWLKNVDVYSYNSSFNRLWLTVDCSFTLLGGITFGCRIIPSSPHLVYKGEPEACNRYFRTRHGDPWCISPYLSPKSASNSSTTITARLWNKKIVLCVLYGEK